MSFLTRPLFAGLLVLLLGLAAPNVARADFFGDVLNAAAEAGGYPEDVPKPAALIALITVANDCVGDTSDDGIKACVEKASNDPTLSPFFSGGMEEITLGLDIYFAIKNGDYIFLVERLGKFAGCAAAAILTGVPVCALADLVIGVLNAVADVAGEVLTLMSEAGAHAKVSGPDYYDMYWYPKIGIAVQILRFQGDAAFEALITPMYDGCYRYFRDIDDMSEDNARITCQGLQTDFGNAVNAQIASVKSNGLKAVAGAWDIKAVAWNKEWGPKCHLSFGVPNAEALEESCYANVAAAFALGRAAAIAKLEDCKNENALTYDLDHCVWYGYEKVAKSELYTAVKPNQQAEAAMKSGNAALKKAMDEEKAFKDKFKNDLAPWLKQCPTSFTAACTADLHSAWTTCAYNIEHIPQKDTGPTIEALQQAEQACTKSYDQLIIQYGMKAFGQPNTYSKKFDPTIRDESLMQRAQQARDDSGCPMAKITPTADQPVDFDVFHLACETQASYQKCVHSLGGDVRPAASQCSPATGVVATDFVNAPCCSAPPVARAPRPAPGGPGVSLVTGTDRMGGDYRGFALDTPDPQLCRQACAAEGKCKSYTYVNAGVKGAQAMCFLKDVAPPATANACCTSGEKTLMVRPE